jgi:hypothetical protein
MMLKFLALQGAPYIYNISRLRVKYANIRLNREMCMRDFVQGMHKFFCFCNRNGTEISIFYFVVYSPISELNKELAHMFHF